MTRKVTKVMQVESIQKAINFKNESNHPISSLPPFEAVSRRAYAVYVTV